jgi:hypothetical protein
MNDNDPPSTTPRRGRPAWNKGKMPGPKPPLRPGHVWAIRAKLQLEKRTRDLAMFNLAIDSKLRGCDLVALGLCSLWSRRSQVECTVRLRLNFARVRARAREHTCPTLRQAAPGSTKKRAICRNQQPCIARSCSSFCRLACKLGMPEMNGPAPGARSWTTGQRRQRICREPPSACVAPSVSVSLLSRWWSTCAIVETASVGLACHGPATRIFRGKPSA